MNYIIAVIGLVVGVIGIRTAMWFMDRKNKTLAAITIVVAIYNIHMAFHYLNL